MSTLLSWKVGYEGKTPPPGAVVRPNEGPLGRPHGRPGRAQHVVAMFGATFVLPLAPASWPALAGSA
jgi:hypothetical protein